MVMIPKALVRWVQDAVGTFNLGDACIPASDTADGLREGVWVAEATDLVNLASWPAAPGCY